MAESIWKAQFWKDAIERAVRAFAAALLPLLVGSGTNIFTFSWKQALGVSLVSAVISLLFSITSNSVSGSGTPSVVTAVQERMAKAATPPPPQSP